MNRTLIAALIASCSVVPAQVDPKKKQPVPLGTVQGQAVREVMWRPPLDEEWKKPVLIKFQRTWKDAQKISKETGKPVMICINMDGEIASEHYAGVRYRSPKIAKVFEPYVCVIASVYRHNPRDYDEKGRRILCPRFGSVTCGEHIWIEPQVYGKFLDNERVAPRHIMVELDGKETYDVYYANDTRSVFDTLQRGIIERRKELTRQVRKRPERPLLDKIGSADVHDRDEIEVAYEKGGRQLKKQILQRAIVSKGADPVDVLRLALYDMDSELNRLAREALMKSKTAMAVELINDALRKPMSEFERNGLIAALERLSGQFPRAKKFANIHKGLAVKSKSVDAEAWVKALADAKIPDKVEWSALESRIDYKAAEAKARPKDGAARLGLAEASLALAVDPQTSKVLAASRKTGAKFARLMLLDAKSHAEQAEKLGAKGWRMDAVVAVLSYYLHDTREAHRRAELAVAALPKGETSWNAMAVLGMFAEQRMAAIKRAERTKRDWPPQWLTDVHSAFAVLSRHPLGTAGHVVSHYDFLVNLSVLGQANRALDAGLERFPDAALLHDRLRGRVLHESGAKGLENTYAQLVKKPDASKNAKWYAGYATIVAAEYYRRKNNLNEAHLAYGRAIAFFDQAIVDNPASRSTADHFAALAISGRARMALEKNQLAESVAQIIASFGRSPTSGASLDGLNQAPMETARLLRTKLETSKQDDLLAKLSGVMKTLPEAAFALPEYEVGVGGARNQVLRRGKLRRPGWRERQRAAEARERRGLEEAKRLQKERLERERKAKAAEKKKTGR